MELSRGDYVDLLQAMAGIDLPALTVSDCVRLRDGVELRIADASANRDVLLIQLERPEVVSDRFLKAAIDGSVWHLEWLIDALKNEEAALDSVLKRYNP